jgi:hypothetical protein
MNELRVDDRFSKALEAELACWSLRGAVQSISNIPCRRLRKMTKRQGGESRLGRSELEFAIKVGQSPAPAAASARSSNRPTTPLGD